MTATIYTPLRELLKESQNGLSKRKGEDGTPVAVLRLADISGGVIDESSPREIFLTDKEVEKYCLRHGDLVCIRVNGSKNLVGRVVPFNSARTWAYCDHFIRFRPLPEAVDSRYLAHFFATKDVRRHVELNMVSSAGQNTVSQGTMLDVLVPLPPLAQQREIVAEIEKQFSRLDEAVANLKRVKANLKRYKAAILKAAVEGRLVPTEAKLARREGRSYESGPQLLQRILETRRSQWKGKGKYREPTAPDTTGLPELPEGRVWSALGQLTSSVKDGPHFSPKYAEEGVPFISGGNIRPDAVDFSSTKFITHELHAELSKRCKPEQGDLLYTKGGTTGIARVNTETREFNVWVHVAVLKLMDSVHPFYLQHALNSPHCYRQSQKYTHGVGNQDLGLTRMVWITVPLPPFAEQVRIAADVDRRLSLVRTVEAEVDANLKRAHALRQSVLGKAFAT